MKKEGELKKRKEERENSCKIIIKNKAEAASRGVSPCITRAASLE